MGSLHCCCCCRYSIRRRPKHYRPNHHMLKPTLLLAMLERPMMHHHANCHCPSNRYSNKPRPNFHTRPLPSKIGFAKPLLRQALLPKAAPPQ